MFKTINNKLFPYINILSSILIFLIFFYKLYPFTFGLNTDNVEELPLIYKQIGKANYLQDKYVNGHLNIYNQIIPYTTFLSVIITFFNPNNIYLIYFGLHISVIILFYLLFRSIMKSLIKGNEFLYLFISMLILFISSKIRFIPAGQFIFLPFLDPTLVATMTSLWSIFFFINYQYLASIFTLFITTIIHPLYSIPILLIFMFTYILEIMQKTKYLTRKSILIIIGYLLSVLPYSVLLYRITFFPKTNNIDLSAVHEIIRSPHHLRIPTISDPLIYLTEYRNFFILILLYLFLNFLIYISGIIPNRLFLQLKKMFADKISTTNRLIFFFIFLLITTSLLSSFKRIDLLIQMNFYRIASVFAPLMIIFVFSLILTPLKNALNKIHMRSFSLTLLIFLLSIIGFSSIISETINKPVQQMNINMEDMVNFIQQNTGRDSLFLNYSDIDIRTLAYRSDYFRFKTFPVYTKGQQDWYDDLLIYYDLKHFVNPNDYQRVKSLLDYNTISLQRVLANINYRVDYILLPTTIKYNDLHFGLIYSNPSYMLFKKE